MMPACLSYGRGRRVPRLSHLQSAVQVRPAAIMCATAGTALKPKRSSKASISAYHAIPSPSRLTTRNGTCTQLLRLARFSRRATASSQRAMRSSEYAGRFILFLSVEGQLHQRALEFGDDPRPVEFFSDRARGGAQTPDAHGVGSELRREPRELGCIVVARKQPAHF